MDSKTLFEILGFLFGASILVYAVIKININKSKTKTIQKGNVVGGDQAGRDIIKK